MTNEQIWRLCDSLQNRVAVLDAKVAELEKQIKDDRGSPPIIPEGEKK